MRIAILECISMPAGFEVEFDRLLVKELKNLGHTPVFLVPQGFTFQLDYHCEVRYLSGGKALTYDGASRFSRPWISLLREIRRKRWFDSAMDVVKKESFDQLIIPTATYRFVRTLLWSKLRNSTIPVQIVFHGINPRERQNFSRYAALSSQYETIRLKVISLRNDFEDYVHQNLFLVPPPALGPEDIRKTGKKPESDTLVLGFFGQFRKEKKLGYLLEAFCQAKFSRPVKLVVQAVSSIPEDKIELETLISKYRGNQNIAFLETRLIGPKWEDAIASVDVLVALYAAERYRYHWGGMFFTALGYQKPVIVSPEMNPEILDEFDIGIRADVSDISHFVKQLEAFIQQFDKKKALYTEELRRANQKYNRASMTKCLLSQ